MLGAGDFEMGEEQRGKKVYRVPIGVRAPSYHAIMDMMDVEDTKDALRRVKLIEYGYVTDDSKSI